MTLTLSAFLVGLIGLTNAKAQSILKSGNGMVLNFMPKDRLSGIPEDQI